MKLFKKKKKRLIIKSPQIFMQHEGVVPLFIYSIVRALLVEQTAMFLTLPLLW